MGSAGGQLLVSLVLGSKPTRLVVVVVFSTEIVERDLGRILGTDAVLICGLSCGRDLRVVRE